MGENVAQMLAGEHTMAEPATAQKPRCRICPWLWGLGIVIALAGVWWLAQRPPSVAPNPFDRRTMQGMATPVRAATAAAARIPYIIQAIGTVTAFNTVTVRSRVDGELQEILFEDGQTVKAGDLLARIDPRTYQVQLDEALGKQAQNVAQLRNAQRDLQRYQTLLKQNSIARQVLDAQQAQVQQWQGVQKSDQAAVDRARLQLDYTRITAPISGRLGLRRVDRGNLVSAGAADGLVTIAQTQPIAVLFTIPQAQLPAVLAQSHQTLTVEVYDREDTRKLASGELLALDNEIDTTTGTLRVKARFANDDAGLFPNQFVNVRLHVNTLDAAVAIPVAAAQYGSVGAFVYVVRADLTVEMRRVTLGASDGAVIAVVAGLDAGERVVIEGSDRLRDGVRVQVQGDTPPATFSPAPSPAALLPSPDPSQSGRRADGARGSAAQAPSTRPMHGSGEAPQERPA